MNRNYFACSVGEPNKPYTDWNLKNCIDNQCFILHESTKQKGNIADIKVGDILLLKHDHRFIGYGRATSTLLTDKDFSLTKGEGWTWRIEVNRWYLGNPIHYYGIEKATIDGTPYATVKPIEETFAKKKIEEIASPF